MSIHTLHRMRGASEIVGNVIMLLVVTALISQAFLYGTPILKKRMDESATAYLENSVTELADAIKITALQGGETRVRMELSGRFSSTPTIKLAKDQTGSYMVEIRGSTLVARYASTDVPLNDFTGPYNESSGGALSKSEGIIGINEPVVVTASSIPLRGGIRLIMKVVPRPIRDPSKNVVTKIEIEPISGKSTRANFPVTVVVKKLGERADVEEGTAGNTTGFTTVRTILVGVGFE